MIREYRALEGQTIYDICLMTYGSLNNLFKLMQDNGFPGVNAYPAPGSYFAWDDTLVVDQSVFVTNSTQAVNYATRASKSGTVYYNINEPGVPGTNHPVTVPPVQIPTDHMYISNSTPTGLVNGSNKNYMLIFTPVINTVSVYLNGILQDPNDDYTISGPNIIMTTAPITGDKIRANFQY